MHNLGLRDLAFLSGDAAAGGSGSGGSGSGGSGGGGGSGGSGGSGGTSPLTLADFDAYWRMDGTYDWGGSFPNPDCSEIDRTGNGNWLYNFASVMGSTYHNTSSTTPYTGVGGGNFATLGTQAEDDGAYEEIGLAVRSWPSSGPLYPGIATGESYTIAFFYRQLSAYQQYAGSGVGDWAKFYGYNGDGNPGEGWAIALNLYDDQWHLVVVGRNHATGKRFYSIDGQAMVESADDGHSLDYFVILPGFKYPDGSPGGDWQGEYEVVGYEVINPQIDAMGVMRRAITQEEIAWIWDDTNGREL